MAATNQRARLPVTLNGVHYEIDLPSYRRSTIEATRSMYDPTGEASEQTLNNQYIWKRTGEDWTLGAGQAYFDAFQDSSRRRFLSSLGVDPWDRRELKLLKAVEAKSSSSTLGKNWLFPLGKRLVWVRNFVDGNGDPNGRSIDYVDNPEAATWSLTNIYSSGAVAGEYYGGVVHDNRSFSYRAKNNRAQQLSISVAGVVTTNNIGAVDTGTPYGLLMAGGRMFDQYDISGSGYSWGGESRLREVKASTVTTIASYESGADPLFTAVVPGPDGFYFAGTARPTSDLIDLSGMPSYIYRAKLDATTGAVQPPSPVAELPEGEVITALTTYGTYLLIGTTQGVRLAQFTSTGGVQYGPLISVPGVDAPPASGDIVNRKFILATRTFPSGVQAFEPEGRYVWFSWGNYDGSHTGVGRVDLGQMVDDLQPAYATDLMYAGQGRVSSVCTYKSRRYFTVDGVGAFGETANYVTSGTLNTGPINFGTAETKRVVSFEAATRALAATESVAWALSDASGTTQHTGSISALGATTQRDTVTALADELASVAFTLTGPGTTTPKLRRWTMRSMVAPNRQEEIYLPVILGARTSHGMGMPVPLAGATEIAGLRALQAARSVVPLVMGTETLSVMIDDILTGQSDRVALHHWGRDGWPDGVWMVKCVTVAQTAVSVQPTIVTSTPVMYSGVAAPSSGDGVVGDLWVDTAAGRLYGPKGAGGWGAGTSLAGPTGATGPQGTDLNPAGTLHAFAGITVPSGYLECGGQSVSRTTYSGLFSAITRTIGTFTVTLASPGVFTTAAAHGLTYGDRVTLTTTGVLPTGLAAYTDYYVTASNLTATTFSLSATFNGANINTSGSQSGTHTVLHTPNGGVTATNFNLPDLRGRVPAGLDWLGGSVSGRLTNTNWGWGVGQGGGEELHTLLTAELPAHAHVQQYANNAIANSGGAGVGGMTSSGGTGPTAAQQSTANAGSGTAHNVMQPTLIVKWLIKT